MVMGSAEWVEMVVQQRGAWFGMVVDRVGQDRRAVEIGVVLEF